MTVAQALTNQKLVLDQITALNTTTPDIIDSTGKLLKRQNTATIHEQAASSTIPLETLQRAFQNIYDTMDAIDTFKLKALDSMKTTVTALSGEVEKSKGYIARAEGAAQNQIGGPQPTPSSSRRCERQQSTTSLARAGAALERIQRGDARDRLCRRPRPRTRRERAVKRVGARSRRRRRDPASRRSCRARSCRSACSARWW